MFNLSKVYLFLLLLLIASCSSTANTTEETAQNEETVQITEEEIAVQQKEEDFGLNTTLPETTPEPYSTQVEEPKYTSLDYKQINESLLNKFNYEDVDLTNADKNNNFILDTLFNYKGIPIVILRVKSVSEYEVERQNEVNQADYYLLAKKPDKKYVKDVLLSDDHKKLLDQFIATTKSSNKVLILMYARDTPVKNYEKDVFKYNRAKYQQSVLMYLYSNIKNVRVEQRFLENLPDDEVFLAAFDYDGSLVRNVYSAPKASGLDWLQAFINYQMELTGLANKNKVELEEALLKTGSPVNKEQSKKKLPTPR